MLPPPEPYCPRCGRKVVWGVAPESTYGPCGRCRGVLKGLQHREKGAVDVKISMDSLRRFLNEFPLPKCCRVNRDGYDSILSLCRPDPTDRSRYIPPPSYRALVEVPLVIDPEVPAGECRLDY